MDCRCGGLSSLSHINRMPDSFFQSDKKRKRNPIGSSSSTRASQKPKGKYVSNSKARSRDEDLSSASGDEPLDIDTMDFRAGRSTIPVVDDECNNENETAAEKRVRLAKGYLAKLRDEVEAGEVSLLANYRYH